MKILSEARDMADEIIDFRRKLHKNPELSFEEEKTGKFITERLKEFGFDRVKDNIGGGGVVGLLSPDKNNINDRKTVALRADMDALPIEENNDHGFVSQNKGVMHACGHDVHMAAVLGAAKILAEYKNDIECNIKVIFQPAEEKLEGAKAMIEDGALERPSVDAIFGLHVDPDIEAGKIGIKHGNMMASSDLLTLAVEGNSSHAARPHQGTDPITIAGHVITVLQNVISREISAREAAVISFGKISGGEASNIIPEIVNLEGTLRTLNSEVRKNVLKKMERAIYHTGRSLDGNIRFEHKQTSPVLACDDNLVNLVKSTVKKELGREKLAELSSGIMGSEDFAFYLEKVPGAFFRLGIHNREKNCIYPLHNPGFKVDENVIPVGSAVLASTAINIHQHS